MQALRKWITKTLRYRATQNNCYAVSMYALNDMINHTFLLFCVFHTICITVVWYSLSNLGSLVQGNGDLIKFPPTSLADLKDSAFGLQTAIGTNFWEIFAFFSLTYFLKHTCSYPGSSLLNAIAGVLFGSVFGTCLCVALTTLGSICAYFVSFFFGNAILRALPSRLNIDTRISQFRNKVIEEKDSNCLGWWLLSLRLVPAFPQVSLHRMIQ